jgi:hypothetical protein
MSDDHSRRGARPGLLRGTALSRAVLGGALLLGALPIGGVLVTAARGDADGATPAVPAVPAVEWSTAGCAMPRSPQAGTPASLSAAMARIEEGGRTRFPGSYAGLEVDERQVRAIVYRVPSAAFDTFVRTSAEDSCVVVRDAAHSSADLGAWQARITADLDRWTTEGVRISTVGARHDGAGVEVGTEDVAGTRQALTAHYGDDAPLVFVEQGPVTTFRAPGPQERPGPRPAAQPGG